MPLGADCKGIGAQDWKDAHVTSVCRDEYFGSAPSLMANIQQL
jgi:hypothetical protein